ncbi:AAA family ATPase [Candidatus Enterococcus murrayae]|uniref:AAA family ATPase n=1 Tax=Candidatus Enterococcus murrayae TaxID=2815321 RepID=A0ABS3HBG4_9ENTE|nr:AAA family ATPase [Enterococcus sp. MJM16]MBO0450777.1 AAA family ATPase [Enterococcus sp. MJM16]
MQYSYSRVSLFQDCPYHFKLRYLDKLTELPNYSASSPLILGHALHKGIETNKEEMLSDYFNSYPVITDDQINEAIKLEAMLPKVKEWLTQFADYDVINEYEINEPSYRGFVDLIVKMPDGQCLVVDFKYSNSIDRYMESEQLHVYKHYLEKHGFKIEQLAYLFVEKTNVRQGKKEDLFQFRKRLVEKLRSAKITFVPIEYDPKKVNDFLVAIKKIEHAKDYPRNVSGNCFSCAAIDAKKKGKWTVLKAPEYLDAIQDENGEIEMILPKNERREKKVDTRPDLWIYADSYVGKSTFIDQFDNLLFLNTDGNTDNTTSPVMYINDEVTKTGRITKRKFAWETFLEVVEELEADSQDYEAVALDLYEDIRDHCRNYIMDKYNWEHESDGSFGKGWSMVTKEFQKAIKRLKAIGLQIIYISKELKKEVTLRGGAVRTTFMPNIDDKTANFTTGTVDLTLRAYVDEEDNHMLQLKKESNVFGGGRYEFLINEVPLEKEAFLEALIDAQKGKTVKSKTTSQETTKDVIGDNKTTKRGRKKKESDTDEVAEEVSKDTTEEKVDEPVKEKKERRKRRKKADVEVTDDETPPGESEPDNEEQEEKEELPKRKRRERKKEEPKEEESKEEKSSRRRRRRDSK